MEEKKDDVMMFFFIFSSHWKNRGGNCGTVLHICCHGAAVEIFALRTNGREGKAWLGTMTELLCDPQSALLFLEGQDNYYEVANWTEDGEEKVPDRANRVKNKKKSKKKKKAEAPQKEEVKNVDEKSNRANGAKIGSLSAMAKPFVPSTFAFYSHRTSFVMRK